MFLSSILPLLVAAGTAQAYTITEVEFFMYKNIDPIVIPGKYTSHLHSFFGSDAINATTTTSEELQEGCSTAKNPNDLSTYWIPTLLVDDAGNWTETIPERFSAYYIGINDAEIPIPQNLKSVAGKSSGTTQAELDPLAGLQWVCEGTPITGDLASFPTSTCPTHLQSLLLFHDCVNEATLETAYSGTQNWKTGFRPVNRCPAGMKRIPQLRFSIRYDLRKILPDGWSGPAPLKLSSGNSYSMHGDFVMGWVPEAAQNMLLATSKTEFLGVDGPLGKSDAGSVCGAGKAKDSDPTHGTYDYETSVKMMGM